MENKAITTKSTNTSVGSVIIKDCPTKELNTVLTYLYTLCGFEKLPDEKQDMVLIGFIREHFSDITLTDIKTAFELGISGETGVNMKHYHNFNSIYFSDVINAYKRYKRSRKELAPKLIESPEMTPKQERDTTTSWLNNHVFPRIEKFFKTGVYDLPDYANTLYNYLDKRKIIPFSTERKSQIKEKAVEQLLMEFRIEKIAKPDERSQIGNVITDILMGGKDTDGLVKTRAKKMALKIFLTKCKEMEIDIIKEIKDYEK